MAHAPQHKLTPMNRVCAHCARAAGINHEPAGQTCAMDGHPGANDIHSGGMRRTTQFPPNGVGLPNSLLSSSRSPSIQWGYAQSSLPGQQAPMETPTHLLSHNVKPPSLPPSLPPSPWYRVHARGNSAQYAPPCPVASQFHDSMPGEEEDEDEVEWGPPPAEGDTGVAPCRARTAQG